MITINISGIEFDVHYLIDFYDDVNITSIKHKGTDFMPFFEDDLDMVYDVMEDYRGRGDR